LERLGLGGFGEVWKAKAPGGLFKAVKIVYGCLGGADGDHNRAVRQELKSLERVKAVRHPFILSLERYDIVNGRLIIVTELADRSLWDRFRECQRQGWPGIPRDELLRYLEETAEALDLMNTEHQLQHLDIKPHNLFLLYNHIKVGDFGLVKDLAGVQAQATSGFTVTYASPETFQGLVTRFSDQYSLAIVYQELLTGQLPFAGTNPQQLMLQHVKGAPNLSPLPPGDREAVGRALAKKPEDRHPSCSDLVRALRRGGAIVPAATTAAPDPGSQKDTPARTPSATAFPLVEKPPERPEVTGDGVLFPALVIGLGGLGLGVVGQLRKTLLERYGPAGTFPHLRFLQLDTDPEAAWGATQGGTDSMLMESEVLLARLQRPAHYLKLGRERETMRSWLPMEILARLPRDQATTAGWRLLGRLAFVTNQPAIMGRLRAELEACSAPEALARAEEHTGLGLRTNRPRVYVVTSLSGGTGSGMFIDLAYEARKLLGQMGHARSEVVGLFLLPAPGRAPARAVANAFAALTELNHFAADPGPPFNRCFVLPLPEETAGAAPLAEVARRAADFLCWDLTTPLARVADQHRAEVSAPEGGMLYETFGAFWFAVPRRPLLQRVARCLGHRLVESWRAQEHLNEAIQAWVVEQLTRQDLSLERLADRLRAACASTLGQVPEALCGATVEQQTSGGPAELSRRPEAAVAALTEIKRLVGSPESTTPARLEEALNKAAHTLRAELNDQLAELALSALSAPQFRLTGTNGIVRERILDALAAAARDQKALAKQQMEQAADLQEQVLFLHTKLFQSSRWWGNRAKTAADLVEALRRYSEAGCRALMVRGVADLYEGLVSELPKYLRGVNCCQPRIAQLLQHFAEPPGRGQAHVDLGLGQYLLPGGCRTLDEAAAHLLAGLSPEELLDLNHKVQAVFGKKFQEQVHVCTAPSTFLKELEEEVYQQVAAFAEAQLSKAHAAEVYLDQHPDDAAMLADLTSAFNEAVPELAGSYLSSSRELCILAVPPGPEGKYFHAMAARALPDRKLIPGASTNDIVFYREQPHVPASALPLLGPAGQEAYRQLLAADPHTPHSRTDIVDWLAAGQRR
jgi:hypothetical protein